MKSLLTCATVLLACVTIADSAFGGKLFFQTRRARSRNCIPSFDYRTSSAKAAASVTSQQAVPISKAGINGGTVETQRLFVLPDATAGSVTLSDAAARLNTNTKTLIVSGVLTHSGGIAGQQSGGKAVIHVSVLGAAGTSSAPLPVLHRQECAYWVRKGEPETFQILLRGDSKHLTGIESAARIRLILEYHPNR